MSGGEEYRYGIVIVIVIKICLWPSWQGGQKRETYV